MIRCGALTRVWPHFHGRSGCHAVLYFSAHCGCGRTKLIKGLQLVPLGRPESDQPSSGHLWLAMPERQGKACSRRPLWWNCTIPCLAPSRPSRLRCRRGRLLSRPFFQVIHHAPDRAVSPSGYAGAVRLAGVRAFQFIARWHPATIVWLLLKVCRLKAPAVYLTPKFRRVLAPIHPR